MFSVEIKYIAVTLTILTYFFMKYKGLKIYQRKTNLIFCIASLASVTVLMTWYTLFA